MAGTGTNIENLDQIIQISDQASKIVKTYPVSFSMSDSYAKQLIQAQNEKNPILKAARYLHAMDLQDAPKKDNIPEAVLQEWKAAAIAANIHLENAQLLVEEGKRLLRTGETQSIHHLRLTQNQNREMVSTVNDEGVQVLAMPALRFQETFKGIALEEAKKSIAGRFDWGALLATLYACFKEATKKGDYQWERQMQAFAKKNPLGENNQIIAIRDPKTGNLQFQLQDGKNLGAEDSDKLIREFNMFLRNAKDKTGDMSVAKAGTARSAVELGQDDPRKLVPSPKKASSPTGGFKNPTAPLPSPTAAGPSNNT